MQQLRSCLAEFMFRRLSTRGAARVFTQLTAKNFKSWRDLPPIRLAPVTGLFGSNSSGKTSIIQLLLLLKQTSASTDRLQPLEFGDERSSIELGSFRDAVHDHDLAEALTVGFRWKPAEVLKVMDPTTAEDLLFTADEIDFETIIRSGRAAMVVDHFRYQTDEVVVCMERSSRRHGRKDPEYGLTASVKGRDYLRRTQGRPWPLPAPVKCYGFPDEALAYFQNSGFLGDLELSFDRQFRDNTYYLGPLRSDPARQYRWQGTRPQDVGISGERAVEALLASRERGRVNTRGYDARRHAKKRITVEQHVAEWLEQLGLVSRFEVERLSEEADIYRVLVQKTTASSPVLLTDVGFGVSQILPVLVLLAFAPAGATVILEQPEIHLHPAVQSGLADVILEAAIVRNVQVIVESHSEHLLRRLQRRVAEGRYNPDELSLYFCSLEGGSSHVHSLELNVMGEIENWPVGYFGDPLSETAAITRAALLRRREMTG